LEVSGSNNGTHFTQQQKKLNWSFHYESSMKLNDRMTKWFFQFIYKAVTKYRITLT
jgi:hypothetical protein